MVLCRARDVSYFYSRWCISRHCRYKVRPYDGNVYLHLLLPRCRFRFALEWRVFLMLQAYCSLFCVFAVPASATHPSLTFSFRQDVIMIFGTSSLRINYCFLRRKITKGVWEEIVFEEHHPVMVHCSPLIDEYHAHWGEVFSLDFKTVCSYMNVWTHIQVITLNVGMMAAGNAIAKK